MLNCKSTIKEYVIVGSTKEIRQYMLEIQVNLVNSIHLCYLKITPYIMSA